MSFATKIYSMLADDSAVAAIVGTRISPYARNRDDDFPAIVFQVPTEDIESDAAGLDLMRIGTGEITCLARTYKEADTLAEAVVAAIVAEANARPLTIARDYGDPYDGSQELVYRSTVSTTLTSG